MVDVQRKDKGSSKDDGNVHTEVNNGHNNRSEGEQVVVTYNKTIPEQRADIFEGQTSANEDVSVVGQMAITLANFPLVKVGHSSKILTEIETCRERGCKRQQGLLKLAPDTAEDPLKNNSVPDDACKRLSNSSRISTIECALHVSETKHINEEDPQATEYVDAASGNTQNCVDRLSDVENPMPLIKKQGSLTGKRCETVMRTLEELQDAGRFEAHEVLVCNLLEFFTKNNYDPDMVASVKIERGVARYYENDLRGSRKLYKDVIRMGELLQNRNLLQGRAYFQLATTYRRQKKFGKAIEYLQRAEELLNHYEPGEDTAELLYNYAVEWLYLYWNSFSDNKGRPVLKARAKEYLERAAAHNDRDDRPRVQSKRKLHFHLSVATLLLDCGTRAARETRKVSKEDIMEAKKHLDVVECQAASDEIPLGRKIKLIKTRSDQYYREGKLSMAKETAEEALALAKGVEMNMHVKPLNERIEERANFLVCLPAPELGLSTARLSDSGWSAEASSSD